MRRPVLSSLFACLAAAACSPNALAPKGGTCHSLSDCQVGLVCIASRCTDDTSSIAGQTPSFELDATVAVVADAALGPAEAGAQEDAAAAVDASSPSDAGSPVDAGRDAGTARDAGSGDAAVVDSAVEEPDAALDAGAEVDAGEAGAG